MDNFEKLVSELLGKAVEESKKQEDILKEFEKRDELVWSALSNQKSNSSERVIEIRYTVGNENNPDVKFNNSNEDLGAVVSALSTILHDLTSDEDHGFDGVDPDITKLVLFHGLRKLVIDNTKNVLMRELVGFVGGVKDE